jgi:hypothetical protein
MASSQSVMEQKSAGEEETAILASVSPSKVKAQVSTFLL